MNAKTPGTMTVKEIAQAVGKNERSVRRWVVQTSDKMSGLADKMSNAEKTKQAAEYTLDEVISIIETGMGKSAAGIFRTAAEKDPTMNMDLPFLSFNQMKNAFTDMMAVAITEAVKQLAPFMKVNHINGTPAAALPALDYYTVLGYANKKGINISEKNLSQLGKAATRMSKDRGLEIRQIDDARYGKVNAYRMDVLKDVMGA